MTWRALSAWPSTWVSIHPGETVYFELPRIEMGGGSGESEGADSWVMEIAGVPSAGRLHLLAPGGRDEHKLSAISLTCILNPHHNLSAMISTCILNPRFLS